MARSTSPPANPSPPAPRAVAPLSKVAWVGLVAVMGGYWWLFFQSGDRVVDPATGQPGAHRRLADVALLLFPETYTELAKIWAGRRWEWLGIADRIPHLALAACWTLAAWGWGALSLRTSRAARLTRLEGLCFAWGLGLSGLSLATLALGWAGLLAAPLVASLVIGGCACLIRWKRWQADWTAGAEAFGAVSDSREGAGSDSPEGAAERGAWLARRGLWLAAPLAGALVLMSLLPPWEFDVREYHLQAPKEWRQAGRIEFLPHNVYANMPLGAEMHALAAMSLWPGALGWWHGAVVGKLVMASYTLLACLTLVAAGSRWYSRTAGVAAAVVYLSTPWVFAVSAIGLNEGVIGCLLLLAFYAIWLWRETSGEGAASASAAKDSAAKDSAAKDSAAKDSAATGLLWTAGFLAGAAAACKYTSVVFVAIPLAGLVAAAPGQNAFARVRSLAWFGLAAACGGGLWYLKNLLVAGNPVYPLLYDWLGGESWGAAKNVRWKSAHGASSHTVSEAITAIKTVLWASPRQGPLLAPLALLGLLDRRRRALGRALLATLLFGAAAWWLVTHRLDRFLVPYYSLAALAAGVGVDRLAAASWRRAAVGVLGVGVAISATQLLMGSTTGDIRFLATLDSLRRDPLLIRVHPAHHYLNAHVGRGRRALLVGDAQPFDLEVDALYNTCFDDCWLESLVRERSPAEQREALCGRGISHVFVHWGEIARYRQPGNYGFTDYVTRDVVAGLVSRGVLRPPVLSSDTAGGIPPMWEIYEVRCPATPSAPPTPDP